MLLQHIRDIKDPEHPYSLEELKVITEDAVEVDDKRSYVRYKNREYILFVCIQLPISYLYQLIKKIICFRVTFTPTVEHCSMATVIGLCLRVKLMRSLPAHYKVTITCEAYFGI